MSLHELGQLFEPFIVARLGIGPRQRLRGTGTAAAASCFV